MMKSVHFVQTPLGVWTLKETDGALTELRFSEHVEADERLRATPVLRQAEHELAEYFAGKRKAFTVPLSLKGTAFQQAVWDALLRIPYGEMRTYSEIAKQVGNPKAARAVGMANHQNPLPVFCPCHRVISANHQLVGYGGGLPLKEFLLALEAKNAR
jgi:methylated-DNA-[protein]-cysteine S-methyltransferase